MNYIDENGLLYVWQKIKALLSGKVDTEDGKSLSTNDYTDDEKSKLAGIEEGAEVNVIDTVKVNSVAQTITDKAVDITVPTATSELTNDSGYTTSSEVEALGYITESEVEAKGYQTSSDVSTAITSALGDITSLSYSVVTELPATGEAGVIYLIASSTTSDNNIYDEYIYVNSAFEKIGSTEIDLSSYVQTSDLTAITNAEIDEIFES